MKDFFAQLRQWRVYRLAGSYAAAAWLILQLTIAVREPLGLPSWTLTAVIGGLMAGFSVALWVGWMQDHRTVLPDGRTVPRSRRHHFAVAVISLLPSVLVAAIFLLFHRSGKNVDPPLTPSEKSIAVLPFESLSSDKDNDFFAEAIQDEILTDLTKVKELQVTGRTSVMAFRAGIGERNLREIGRSLGVAYVLEGSVQRAGGKVKVAARLIRVETGQELWGNPYEGDLKNLFAIQSRIAEQIAGNLQAQLSSDEKKAIRARPTENLEALDLYLQAKELIGDFQAQGDYRATLLKSLRLLNEAIEKDQKFALAYCLEAKAHDQLYWLDIDHTTTRLAREAAAVAAALSLKPVLPEAHLAHAMLLYHGSHDFARALDELAIVRQALPNSTEMLAITSYIDRAQGRWPEAVQAQEKAKSLDPRNGTLLNDLVVTYDMLRDYRNEERIGDAAIAAVPQQAALYRLMKAQIYIETGQPEACRAILGTLPVDDDPNGGTTSTRMAVALYEGNFAEAMQILAAAKSDWIVNLTGTREPREWVEALIARAAGETVRAKAAMLAARTVVENGARGQPEDPRTLSLLGRIDAGLGRKEDALREGRRAMELLPVGMDAMNGPVMETSLAMIYAWTGETDLAVALLEPLSTLPGGPHYGELQLDPAWEVLRGNPRFKQLVAAMKPN